MFMWQEANLRMVLKLTTNSTAINSKTIDDFSLSNSDVLLTLPLLQLHCLYHSFLAVALWIDPLPVHRSGSGGTAAEVKVHQLSGRDAVRKPFHEVHVHQRGGVGSRRRRHLLQSMCFFSQLILSCKESHQFVHWLHTRLVCYARDDFLFLFHHSFDCAGKSVSQFASFSTTEIWTDLLW